MTARMSQTFKKSMTMSPPCLVPKGMPIGPPNSPSENPINVEGNVLSRKRIEYKWLAMFTVSIGTFMSTLDASIVNVSLPTIMDSLDADLSTVQWVVSIYLLVITGLLLSLGRLADLIGRKPIYITGFAIFTIGSLLCGLSRSIWLLIAFRGLQAIGAAMIMINGPAIVADAFPRNERGKAMGMIGSVVATGLTVGPALGGFLVALRGWPLIFFINLPVGAFGIFVAWRVLHTSRAGGERHFDVPGALLLLVSLVCLSLGLSEGPETGWSALPIVSLFTSSLVFGVLFVLRECTAVHPMLDLTLFRNRLFAAASASAFINYVATFAVTFLMPFYLSQVLGYPPQKVGLTLTAVPITVALVAPISGSLSDRIGSRLLGSLGLALASVGLMLIGLLGRDPSPQRVLLALVVTGLGTAIFQSPNSSSIMGAVPPTMLGIASGMIATMRNLGMATGVAVTSAIYSTRRMHYASEFEITTASVLAFRDAFIAAALICALGVIASAVRGGGVIERGSCEP